MPTPINREQVQELLTDGAQLVPTCRLDDHLPVVCERLAQSGWDTCFVVDDQRVVLGRLGRRAIRTREDVSVEEAMAPGPSTIRPSARLRNVVEWMRTQNLTNLPVTTSNGRLTGVLTRPDADVVWPKAPRLTPGATSSADGNA